MPFGVFGVGEQNAPSICFKDVQRMFVRVPHLENVLRTAKRTDLVIASSKHGNDCHDWEMSAVRAVLFGRQSFVERSKKNEFWQGPSCRCKVNFTLQQFAASTSTYVSYINYAARRLSALLHLWQGTKSLEPPDLSALATCQTQFRCHWHWGHWGHWPACSATSQIAEASRTFDNQNELLHIATQPQWRKKIKLHAEMAKICRDAIWPISLKALGGLCPGQKLCKSPKRFLCEARRCKETVDVSWCITNRIQLYKK